jgi:hypothetical protein
MIQHFVYRDFNSISIALEFQSRWERLQTTDIPKRLVGMHKSYNYFQSIQLFRESTATEGAKPPIAEVQAKEADDLPDGQHAYHGLFFDFDADATKLGLATREEALALSKKHASLLVTWFQEQFDVPNEFIQIWFSGSKGFHVIVRPEIFAIKPHQHLTYICKRVTDAMKLNLQLTTLDASIYARRRMWRIANTRHEKTQLFKVELSPRELISGSIPSILEKARAPLHDYSKHPFFNTSDLYEEEAIVPDLVHPIPAATRWWQEYVEMYDTALQMQRLRPTKPIKMPPGASDFPVCIRDILDNGPKPGGASRNRVMLPVIGMYKDAGVSKEECFTHLSEWTHKHFPDPKGLRERLANAKTATEAGYRSDQYHFSCRSILSCGTPSSPVRCVTQEKCPWIEKPEDQLPATAPLVDIGDAVRPEMMGIEFRSPITINVVGSKQYVVPTEFDITCRPDPDNHPCCELCPVNVPPSPGHLIKVKPLTAEYAMRFADIALPMRDGYIKKMLEIPKACPAHKLEHKKSVSIVSINAMPMADSLKTLQREDDGDFDDMENRVASLMPQDGYALYSNDIVQGENYMITATVATNPKDNSLVFFVKEKEAAKTEIQTFAMTEDLYEKLTMFRPDPLQTVKEKFYEIHKDFENNVHKIGGRIDLSIATELCFHTPYGFRLLGTTVDRGWGELLVVGDTGTGKSTLVKRLMGHFGVGDFITGNEASRVSLLGGNAMVNTKWAMQWGRFPRNDRRLLVIDELANMSQDDFSLLKSARTEGTVRGRGMTNVTFPAVKARVRMIMISNPRSGRAIDSYAYGLDAVREIFKEEADLRRIDLAAITKLDDVNEDEYMKRRLPAEVPHRYTSDLCRNRVIWAWSRDPRHIEFSPEAEQAIITHTARLGDRYRSDVPLAQRSDLHNKLARESVATAMCLFSTDLQGEKVLVTKEHVEFAGEMIDAFYSSEAMGYKKYAIEYQRQNNLGPDLLKEARSPHHAAAQPRLVRRQPDPGQGAPPPGPEGHGGRRTRLGHDHVALPHQPLLDQERRHDVSQDPLVHEVPEGVPGEAGPGGRLPASPPRRLSPPPVRSPSRRRHLLITAPVHKPTLPRAHTPELPRPPAVVPRALAHSTAGAAASWTRSTSAI